MKILIVVQDKIHAMDLALPYDYFRSDVNNTVIIAAENVGRYHTYGGIEIEINTTIKSIIDVDVVWFCGKEELSDVSVGTINWLKEIAPRAKYIITLGSSTSVLIESGIIRQHALTMSNIMRKKYKKEHLKYIEKPIVVDEKFITASTSVYRYNVLYELLIRIYEPRHLNQLSKTLGLSTSMAKPPEINDKEYRHSHRRHHRAIQKHSKTIAKLEKTAKESVVFYLFDDMRVIDFVSAHHIITHFPLKRRYIADTRGPIYIEGDGFKIIANEAIQSVHKAKLLVLPGGQGINKVMVNTFLSHWLTKICPKSYRVLAIAEAEQLIGVCGLLRDIDVDVLMNLPLGEGKYLLTQNHLDARRALYKIAKSSYGLDEDKFFRHFSSRYQLE